MPRDLSQLRQSIVEAVAAIDRQMLHRVWQELDYRIDICRVTKGGHIEHLYGRTETWSVSPSVDMLPFGVTIPASVQQRSEIPEGLMNYPVYPTFLCGLVSLKTVYASRNMCGNINYKIVQYGELFVRHTRN
jgi:hypothetical protein